MVMDLPRVDTTFRAACAPRKVMREDDFVKVCCNCCLLDDVYCKEEDLRYLFKRVIPTGVPYAEMHEFENALLYVAKRKRVSALSIFNQVASSQAPVIQADSPGGKKGEHKYTKRDLLPKVFCSIPPETPPQWNFVPAGLMEEMDGSKPPRRLGVFYDVPAEARRAARIARNLGVGAAANAAREA